MGQSRKRVTAIAMSLALTASMMPGYTAFAGTEDNFTIFSVSGGEYSGRYYDQLDPNSKKIYDAVLNSSIGQKGPTNERIQITLSEAITISDVTLTATGKMVKLRDGKYHRECLVNYGNGDQSEGKDGEAIDALERVERDLYYPAMFALIHDHPEIPWIVNLSAIAGATYTAWAGEGAVAQEVGGTQYFMPDQQAIVDSWPVNEKVKGSIEVTGLTFILPENVIDQMNGQDQAVWDYQVMRNAIDSAKSRLESDDYGYNVDEAGISTYEQVKRIHDYVIDHVSYVTQGAEARKYQSSYGALVEGMGACASYATSFEILCKEYGIPCATISGYLKSTSAAEEKGIPHAWNYVRMDDGKWYAVDTTQDHQLAATDRYTYFLVGASTPKLRNSQYDSVRFSQSHAEDPTLGYGLAYTFRYPVLNDSAYEPPQTTVSVSGIALSEASMTVKAGEKKSLTATLSPENATNKSVTWASSNPAAATVDNGVVTGISEGSAVITVTTAEGNFSAACEIRVEKNNKSVPVEGIFLNMSEFGLTNVQGGEMKLKATVVPTNASNQKVFWTTSDPGIATVDENGLVIPLAPGKVTITAQTEEGGFTASCHFTVEDSSKIISRVDILESGIVLNEGEKQSLTAVVRPEDKADQNVNWSSEDESVATVDQNGVVTGLKKGTAVIRAASAADPSRAGQCVVNVISAVPVAGISLDHKNVELNLKDGAGKESGIQLNAKVTPDNAANTTVLWSSDNPQVAEVSGNGWVTPVSAGEALITAQTPDGKVTAQCKVTVKQKEDAPFEGYISIQEQSLTLNVGKVFTMAYKVSPDNSKVVWESSDASVVKVSPQGVIKALKPGEAQVKVWIADHPEYSTYCDVTVPE